MTENPGVTGRKPWDGVPPRGPMHRLPSLEAESGLKRGAIYANQKLGLFPPMVKIGQRASGVPDSWLRAYLEHRAECALAKAAG